MVMAEREGFDPLPRRTAENLDFFWPVKGRLRAGLYHPFGSPAMRFGGLTHQLVGLPSHFPPALGVWVWFEGQGEFELALRIWRRSSFLLVQRLRQSAMYLQYSSSPAAAQPNEHFMMRLIGVHEHDRFGRKTITVCRSTACSGGGRDQLRSLISRTWTTSR